MKKIEANWPILPSGIWNGSSIQTLTRHLHELACRSEQYHDESLYQVVTTIDEMINQIIDDNSPPDDEQLRTLDGQLDELRRLAGKPARTTTPHIATVESQMPAAPYDLAILCETDNQMDAYVEGLESSGLRCRKTADADELQVILVGPGTKALLIDAALLGTQALEPILHLLKLNRSAAPALFIIADQSTIDVRLTALRAGAAHLFTRPVDVAQLLSGLRYHLFPQLKPRHRVLIVEDDEAQANFAGKLLQKGGLEALTITDPLSVIDAVVRFEPDLILMDLYMPGADGIELTRVIRDRWESSAIPVVFLSGEGDPEKKLLALQAGADDFLTKPVRPQQLLATINTRIERAHQIAAVALKQIDVSTRPSSRRTLLNRLDMLLGEAGEQAGFRALLVIYLTDSGSIDAEQHMPINAFADKAQAHLRENDLLASLDQNRLALLYRRDDEKALEDLAEQLYATLSKTRVSDKPLCVGIGMVLLNGADRNAYEQLCHAEARAESAHRRGVRGFELHGETAEESDAPSHTTMAKHEGFLNAIREGAIPFKRQQYNSCLDTAPKTIELIPMPAPATHHEDPYLTAAKNDLIREFDHFVCIQALQALGDMVVQGRSERLIFRQSASVATEPDYLDFIRSELRRRQIVGTGLMVEFDLPSLAANLKAARELIGELTGMGMTVTLGNFACNETAYKVLAYLRADAVRPHRSLLRIGTERIQHIARQLHSLHAEIILPRVARHGEIALPWTEYADFIQADFSD
ncbi:MAG: response regulator [Candidatus Thiodiazotropha sp.]